MPAPGTYRLLIRGCSEQTQIVRGVMLDGKPLTPAAIVQLGATGGWARTTNDWRYFLVCGPDGQPAGIKLTAGEHRLRLERLTGSMNLDLLAWEPAR